MSFRTKLFAQNVVFIKYWVKQGPLCAGEKILLRRTSWRLNFLRTTLAYYQCREKEACPCWDTHVPSPQIGRCERTELSAWSWLRYPQFSDGWDHRRLMGNSEAPGGCFFFKNTFQNIKYVYFSLFLLPLCPSKWYVNHWMWKWDFGFLTTIHLL